MKNSVKTYHLSKINEWKHLVKAGDAFYISGTVYTARDAAHKKITEAISKDEKIPFDLNGAAIYYAGPTETPEGCVVGSIGPTTSSRMDKFTPALLDLGLAVTIGKGDRSSEVVASIGKNKALYLCAVGGAGAYIANCVKSCEVIAYEELGCESVKKLEIENLLVFCGIDTEKNTIFKR